MRSDEGMRRSRRREPMFRIKLVSVHVEEEIGVEFRQS